jgi:hypothetical protein
MSRRFKDPNDDSPASSSEGRNDEFVTVVAYLRRPLSNPGPCMESVVKSVAGALQVKSVNLLFMGSAESPPTDRWSLRTQDGRRSVVFDQSRAAIDSPTLFYGFDFGTADVAAMLASLGRKGAGSNKFFDYTFACSYKSHAIGGRLLTPQWDPMWNLTISRSALTDKVPGSVIAQIAEGALAEFDAAGEVYCGFAEIESVEVTSSGHYYNWLRSHSDFIDREIEHECWIDAGVGRHQRVRRVFPVNLLSKEHVAILGGEVFLAEYDEFLRTKAMIQFRPPKFPYVQRLQSGAVILRTWPEFLKFSRQLRESPPPSGPAAWLRRRFREAGLLI